MLLPDRVAGLVEMHAVGLVEFGPQPAVGRQHYGGEIDVRAEWSFAHSAAMTWSKPCRRHRLGFSRRIEVGSLRHKVRLKSLKKYLV